MSWFFFIPIIAGFFYALSSLFLKRSFEEGVGLVRTLFVSNLMMGGVILILLFFQIEEVQWDRIGYPFIASLFFFLGQAFTFLAIRVGDVSVMSPVMGSKVIFVALGAWVFFDRAFQVKDWLAVVLAGLAVILIGFPRKGAAPESTRKIAASIGFALISCAFFAGSDNLVSEWAVDFGRPAFIVVQFICVALLSLFLIPFFSEPLRTVPRKAIPWLLVGSFLLGFQALLFGTVLIFSDATEMNVIFTTRGLWAVLLVVCVGSWFGNFEREQGVRTMVLRLTGSVLIIGAIALMLLG